MDHAPQRRFSYTPVADAINASLSRDTGPVDRDLALTVPAVLRGRNLICSISTLPLVQYTADGSLVPSPFLSQIDPDVANVVTVAQTVEDLLFDGIAWWRVKGYGLIGGTLRPVQARRIDPCTVSLTPPPGQPSRSPLPSGQDPHEAVVYVDGHAVPAREMIRFDSPNPALRIAAARSIRKALLVDKLATVFADNPRPLDYFEPSEYATSDPEDDDIREFLSQWKLYRKGNSTGYIPRDYQYKSVSQPSPVDLQLVQLQAQAALEIANALGVDPEDLGINTTSRTYQNAIDRRRDRINDVLAPYMVAVEQRLSMNDLTVRGNTVRMDLDNYLKSNPTERWSVYTSAVQLGVINDPEEIRLKEGWGPMPPKPQTTPEPDPDTPPAEPADDSTQDADQEVDAAKQPDRVMTASPAQFTFDRPRALSSPRAPREFVDLPLQTFAVDPEQRTITGLSVPYGKQTSKYGGIRFEKGALEYGEVSHVKLLMHHDPWQPIGVATELKETRDGLVAKFRLDRSPEADTALMKAEDGVLDGLSVGVDFTDEDVVEDPRYRGGLLVKRADLREVSLTAMPAFRDARVTKVAASDDNTQEDPVADTEPTTTEPVTAPEPTPAPVVPAPEPTAQTSAAAPTITLTQDQFTALLARVTPASTPAPAVADPPAVVDPTSRPVPTGVQVTREALPYRFARGQMVPTSDDDITAGAHSFGRDVLAMRSAGDEYGRTPAGKRVMGMLERYHNAVTRNFTIPTTATDITALIPTEVLPYQASPAFHLPLFELVNKGPLPNGLQPFLPPAMNETTTTIAVATHSEGTEPTKTEFTTQGSAVIPSPLSGKVNITRVALDRVSNVDQLVWDELVKQYYKTIEDRVATFLATLSAADNIALDGLSHIGLADTWASAYIFLQKNRRYMFVALALEEALFKAFAAARDTSGAGALLYPPVSFTPTNVAGTMAERYLSINLNGVTGIMSGALSTGNSYLFDPAYVSGHATAPTRLDFAGSGASDIYTPVDTVDVAVWGYSAFYNTQIAAVREVTFNNAS